MLLQKPKQSYYTLVKSAHEAELLCEAILT